MLDDKNRLEQELYTKVSVVNNLRRGGDSLIKRRAVCDVAQRKEAQIARAGID